MRHRVLLTRHAERDLAEIHDYVSQHASPRRAAGLLAKLRDEVLKLALEPGRGSWPRELLELGVRDFRQISVRPYRIIYRVLEARVIVLVIVDGRRDLRLLLERRLLGG